MVLFYDIAVAKYNGKHAATNAMLLVEKHH